MQKAAIPRLFPGCPAYLSKPAPKKKRKSPTKERELENVHQNTQASKRRKKNQDLDASDEISNLEHLENPKYENSGMPSADDGANRKLMFSSIFEFQTNIPAPLSWSRQNISDESTRVVQFSQWTVRKHGTDDIRTVRTKQILIDETLTVRINVMGRRLKPEEFGLERNVALNVEDIENIIKIVDNSRICSGCAEISASENIITSFTCRDKKGYLRHTFCPLLLPKENDRANKCKFCARAKHILNQKMVRIKKSKEVTKKYMKLTNLTRKVSQVSLTDFNDSLICCRASKKKTDVIFFIGGKTDLGGEIDPFKVTGVKGCFHDFL